MRFDELSKLGPDQCSHRIGGARVDGSNLPQKLGVGQKEFGPPFYRLLACTLLRNRYRPESARPPGGTEAHPQIIAQPVGHLIRSFVSWFVGRLPLRTEKEIDCQGGSQNSHDRIGVYSKIYRIALGNFAWL